MLVHFRKVNFLFRLNFNPVTFFPLSSSKERFEFACCKCCKKLKINRLNQSQQKNRTLSQLSVFKKKKTPNYTNLLENSHVHQLASFDLKYVVRQFCKSAFVSPSSELLKYLAQKLS